ncbi:unnamed protein product [Clonostachys rosea]|uniref:AAA+ ATPase domain-containing protein n=1 Tax=Bionectria ochroleuca TaxID=29856 RepID=A0ABY6UYL5_BIOOC|nr:unnamed protein product [Clonostachys rosea]
MPALEALAPGISQILGNFHAAISGDLNVFTYAALAMAILGFVHTYINRFFSLIEPCFSSTVHVDMERDQVYDMLSDWLEKRGINSSARTSLVTIANDRQAKKKFDQMGRKSLVYQPWDGSFTFWYRGHRICYSSSVERSRSRWMQEQVTLTCLGWSTDILRQLFDECRQEYLDNVKGKTIIFENREDCWHRVDEKAIRPLSTIILNQGAKKLLLDDIEGFISVETQRWYTRRALPYRRGYLLYGPPGTGKSSLSLSIAGQFDLDIYVISVPDASDSDLKELFQDLPSRCIVLLEDIDAVGLSKVSDPDSELESDSDSGSGSGRVTLSGLLNVLDGVTSQDGRIVIMTTNHREKLDPALIRPGRIDRQVLLPLADAEVIHSVFMFLFGSTEDVDGEKAKSEETTEEVKKDAITRSKAQKFASIVPASTFSQAEIISYLMLHKHDPDSALAQCQSWVDEKLK